LLLLLLLLRLTLALLLLTCRCCLRRSLGDTAYAQSKYDLARQLLAGTIAGRDYADFLTNLCYDHIVTATVKPNL
jgi:hypothetical protein